MEIPKNCVIFSYPKMGESGKFLPENLQNLSGLTGCTNQCKAYESEAKFIQNLGFELIAVSSQNAAKMDEFRSGIGANYKFISDENFNLEKQIGLETFITLDGKKFYHRQTLIFKDAKLIKRFERVSDPQNDAKNVVEILKTIV
ncbi:MAG: redoxin domain-containing protein [Campylobacter sp.]